MPENLSTICETLRSVSLQLKSLNKGEDEDHPLFQDISRALKQTESSADELYKCLKDNLDKLKKLPENIFQTLASLCGLDPDKGEEEQGPGSTSEERMSDTVHGKVPDKRKAHAGQERNASNVEMEGQTNAGPDQQNRNYRKNGQGTAETDRKNISYKKQDPAAKDDCRQTLTHQQLYRRGPHGVRIDVNPLEHMSKSEMDKMLTKEDLPTNMSKTFTAKSYESPEQNAGGGELEKWKHLAEDQAKQLEEKRTDIKKPLEQNADRKELENWKHLAEDRVTQLDEKEKEIKILKQQVDDVKTELEQTRERQEKELEGKQKIINKLEYQVNKNATEIYLLDEKIAKLSQDLHNKSEENNKSRDTIKDLEKLCYDLDGKNKGWKMAHQQAQKEHEQEVRKLHQEIESLTKSRDDLRDRFSKVAGQKLNENNPDIADLSDPDRAMKLAERYSAIYDDEWTDAFQEQQEKMKRKTEDVVKYLLEVLKASYQFCEKTAAIQMEALHNVFLHPCQDASLERNAMGAQGGLLDKPRIKSAEDKTLKDLRRKIASNMVSEVKEQFLVKFKKETADKKAMDLSLPYIGKCVEICWLMVLHDPQLHMGVDIKPDTRMDTNVYASYQNSGSVIEYLVWPPLFNGKNGGLLAKGTAQPRKEQGKGKGK